MRRKRKSNFKLSPKYLYVFFSILCVVFVVLSFKYSTQFAGVKTSIGSVITPMQKGINSVGLYISSRFDLFQSNQSLIEENKKLLAKVNSLSYDNKILASENVELDTYRKAFALDKKYPNYPKVAARVVSRDGNNWFNVFTIDKGTADGISVDMNVLAGNGLVGIVTAAGKHYSTVRSIIDDKSIVSGMFISTSETCFVNGNLESMSEGYINVDMISNAAKVKNGAEVVTSHVSSKYLQGLLIGYISDLKEDQTTLTKTARLTPVVNFDKLDLVLVITKKKEKAEVEEVNKK